jgi:hypothetical protein
MTTKENEKSLANRSLRGFLEYGAQKRLHTVRIHAGLRSVWGNSVLRSEALASERRHFP